MNGVEPTGERLQKVLARVGLGSRREIDGWIAAGRVRVDGRIARPGTRIAGRERVAIDGKLVALSNTRRARAPRVIALHKPAGTICTHRDPQRRPSIYRLLPPAPEDGRWIAVGRLDFNTSGLILLTDDGELAHRLMHPRHEITRIYKVRVRGEANASQLRNLRRGVTVDGELLACDRVCIAGGRGHNKWYECHLHTGRKHEVRRLWAACGLQVARLIRTGFGGISLSPELRAGHTQELKPQQWRALYRLVALSVPPVSQARRRAASSGGRN